MSSSRERRLHLYRIVRRDFRLVAAETWPLNSDNPRSKKLTTRLNKSSGETMTLQTRYTGELKNRDRDRDRDRVCKDNKDNRDREGASKMNDIINPQTLS